VFKTFRSGFQERRAPAAPMFLLEILPNRGTTLMHENGNPEDMCVVEEWMYELLEEDRVAEPECDVRVSDGLHWMYRASLLRYN
jgi:hypothetical protein